MVAKLSDNRTISGFSEMSLGEELHNPCQDQFVPTPVDSANLDRVGAATTDSNNDEHDLLIENTASDVGRIKESKVEGRRIVDISFFLQELHDKFDGHSRGIECHFRDLKLERYVDHGLRTQLFFRCQMCCYSFDIWTDPNDSNIMGINESAVCGSISSGIGCSTLQQQLSAMGVPPMSHVTYRRYRNSLFDNFQGLAAKEMEEAAKIEKEIAIRKGHVINGIPYITIVADGCWAKRSDNCGKHDSLSGVATIFGCESKKALFVAVRNKYCAVDAKAKQLNKDPPKHVCYKNWGRDQSSTAMETDIIKEGFKNSIEMNGLIYKTLISDGDSSVYQAIRDADPYGAHGVIVDKVECNNHLFRNLCKKIRNASKATLKCGPTKGVTSVTALRDRVARSGLKLRKHIESARDLREAEDVPRAEKVKRLQNDILYLLCHVFGEHSACDSLPMPCERISNENNLIPELRKTGLYSAVFEAVRYLSCHASSLLRKVTNNVAEACNSIVNKLNAGKRINNCARNSYEMRCYGAVVQHNTQKLLSKVHIAMKKRVPLAVSKMESARRLQIRLNAALRREKGRSKRRVWQGTDEDYGPTCRQPDVPKEVYNILVENHFGKLKKNQEKRCQIERDTVSQSDCELWHHLRRDMITASKFGPICRMLESTSCSGMVSSIRYPKVLDTAAVLFGNANEQTARKALEVKLGKQIIPCGLFIDPQIPYLGASPDGIIDTDGIVEIKCPFSAKNVPLENALANNSNLRGIFDKKNIDAMSKTHAYFYQVQGQLHITMRSYCIFALWTSVDLKYIKVIRDDEFWRSKMQPFLERFYMECLLPEIVDSRRDRSMPIRNPEYILRAQERLKRTKLLTVSRKRNRLSELLHPSKKRLEVVTRNTNTSSALKQKLQTLSDRAVTGSHESEEQCNTWMPVVVTARKPFSEADYAALETCRLSVSTEEVIANVVPSTSLLNDSSIDLFQLVIEENQMGTKFSFLPAACSAFLHCVKLCEAEKDMQIIGGNESRHWCCVHYDGSHLIIYDSMCPGEYDILHEDIKMYIRVRYPFVKTNCIVVQPVVRQPDPYSCGVYAAAFAATIALGGDPSCVRYSTDASKMRLHFTSVIRNRRLSSFPVE